MLTWWRLWWLVMLAFLLPIFSVLIPQITLGKKMIGGGYMREEIINTILPYFSDDIRGVLVDIFTKSIAGEYVVYELLAVNLGLFLAWLTFIVVSVVMSGFNWHKKESFKREQHILRK
jgi:hypothetical protein